MQPDTEVSVSIPPIKRPFYGIVIGNGSTPETIRVKLISEHGERIVEIDRSSVTLWNKPQH